MAGSQWAACHGSLLRVVTSWREDDQHCTVSQRVFATVTLVSGRTTPWCLTGQNRTGEHEEYTVKGQTPPGRLPHTGKKSTEEKGAGNMRREVMYQRCAGIDVHLRLRARVSEEYRGGTTTQRDPHVPQ
jgi:hypothetical protein